MFLTRKFFPLLVIFFILGMEAGCSSYREKGINQDKDQPKPPADHKPAEKDA